MEYYCIVTQNPKLKVNMGVMFKRRPEDFIFTIILSGKWLELEQFSHHFLPCSLWIVMCWRLVLGSYTLFCFSSIYTYLYSFLPVDNVKQLFPAGFWHKINGEHPFPKDLKSCRSYYSYMLLLPSFCKNYMRIKIILAWVAIFCYYMTMNFPIFLGMYRHCTVYCRYRSYAIYASIINNRPSIILAR